MNRREDLPGHKGLGLSGIGELSIGDHTETSLSTLQTPKLDFNGDTGLACALDIRLGNSDVLLVRLSNNHGQEGFFNLRKKYKDIHRRGWRLP